MKRYVKVVINAFQRIVTHLSFSLHKLFYRQKENKWVVAGEETASMLKTIGDAIPNASTVNFKDNRFYNFAYTHSFKDVTYQKALSLISRPWLLGKLLTQTRNFLYIGGTGFLGFYDDGRAWEFKFVKSKGCKLICYFAGSEIRSFELLNKFAKENDIDVVTTYQQYALPGINSEARELRRKKLGQAADKYADFIFNPSIDQMAYIERKTLPCFYFIKKDYFKPNLKKLDNLNNIIIVHGPSSPLIKATPIVRAAIKKLREEGYQFDYRELIGVPHDEMLSNLHEAHIVLNEFYAFVPGIFTLEALANSCAVLTSADPEIEPSLPLDCGEAWKITPYWKVYDNLKLLLDNPDLIKKYAKTGYNWALEHCEETQSLTKFLDILKSNNDCHYD